MSQLPEDSAPLSAEEFFAEYGVNVADGVEDSLAVQTQVQEYIAERAAQEVMGEVAKHGALMAYRTKLRHDAVKAIVAIPGINPTDVGAIIEMQQAIRVWIDIERWVRQMVAYNDQVQEAAGAATEPDDEGA